MKLDDGKRPWETRDRLSRFEVVVLDKDGAPKKSQDDVVMGYGGAGLLKKGQQFSAQGFVDASINN